MKMLLFKPELGTLKLFNYPSDENISDLVEKRDFNVLPVIIDNVSYNFYVGSLKSKLNTKKPWSFYKRNTNLKLYGNLVIESSEGRDINAEDILRIKSHIVVNPKGYMIYID